MNCGEVDVLASTSGCLRGLSTLRTMLGGFSAQFSCTVGAFPRGNDGEVCWLSSRTVVSEAVTPVAAGDGRPSLGAGEGRT